MATGPGTQPLDEAENFEAGVALVYSASSGSIKRALDTLLDHDWMTGELSGADLEVAALPRLFFLGLLEPADRTPVLRRMQQRAAADLAELTALEKRLDAMTVPAEVREVAAYQRATLAYGIASGRHAVTWFGELADRGGPEG